MAFRVVQQNDIENLFNRLFAIEPEASSTKKLEIKLSLAWNDPGMTRIFCV